jgi:hypothetical protein
MKLAATTRRSLQVAYRSKCPFVDACCRAEMPNLGSTPASPTFTPAKRSKRATGPTCRPSLVKTSLHLGTCALLQWGNHLW